MRIQDLIFGIAVFIIIAFNIMNYVTKPGVLELTSSLWINALCYKFTNSPKAAPILLSSLLIQTASQALLKWNVQNVEVLEVASPNLFASLTGFNLQTVIHEAGHALASKIVFKNPCPKITLFPFTEGRTKYDTQELTSFGNRLGGKRQAIAFVSGGGPATSFMVSSTAMLIGKVVKNRFHKLSLYLIAYGRMDLFVHAFYAFSAKFSSNSRMSHDFFSLSQAGVPPLIIAVAFLATSLFLEFGI